MGGMAAGQWMGQRVAPTGFAFAATPLVVVNLAPFRSARLCGCDGILLRLAAAVSACGSACGPRLVRWRPTRACLTRACSRPPRTSSSTCPGPPTPPPRAGERGQWRRARSLLPVRTDRLASITHLSYLIRLLCHLLHLIFFLPSHVRPMTGSKQREVAAGDEGLYTLLFARCLSTQDGGGKGGAAGALASEPNRREPSVTVQFNLQAAFWNPVHTQAQSGCCLRGRGGKFRVALRALTSGRSPLPPRALTSCRRARSSCRCSFCASPSPSPRPALSGPTSS